jgi:hypothetical protein
MTLRSIRVAIPLVVIVGLLTACGSTVQQQVTTTLPDPFSSVSPPTGESAGVPLQSPVAPSGGGPGTAPRQQLPTGPSMGGPTPAGTPVRSVLVPANGAPGVTDTTVKIGFYIISGYSDAASAAGVTGADTGDQEALIRSVVAYVNARGGIAGRRVTPVVHDVDVALATTNPAGEQQAACSAFTQDTKVFAVASLLGFGDGNFYRCMTAARVPVVTTGEFSVRSLFKEFPDTLYQPADMDYNRMLFTNAVQLKSLGWYGKTPKIGIVQVDSPQSREATEDGIVRGLRSIGLAPALTYSVAAGNAGVSQYQAAVLRFAAEGITHVMFSQQAYAYYFMLQAEPQRYRPSYAIDSRQDPHGVLQPNVSANQLARAAGMGWIPVQDVAAEPAAPREKQCRQAVKGSGQSTAGATAHLGAVWICDQVFFLQAALSRAHGMDLRGFRQAVESMGSSGFQPSSTFGSHFGPGRLHAGARLYRMNAYDAKCSCFAYVTGIRETA